MKSHRFVDSATVYVAAGNGGDGCMSFRREKCVPFGGPDGGDGGRGGNVTLRADRDTDSLLRVYFAPHQRAEHGGNGMGQAMHGRQGKDLLVLVPRGTEVRNAETGEILADLVEHGAELLVARGGRGGLGNIHWKSSTHQAPREHTGGVEGEQFTLRLELKLVADVGLVGFPNAGKSSLLSDLSDAHPKVAAYPFTTLNPIIGTIIYDDYSRLTVADIPGIIKGAHDGVGLGYDFLKHIERAAALLFVIDMAGYDGRKPHEDYAVLKEELKRYRPDLLKRPSLVVANKMDLPEAAENLKAFRRKTRARVLRVSALSGEGIDEVKQALREMSATARERAEAAKAAKAAEASETVAGDAEPQA